MHVCRWLQGEGTDLPEAEGEGVEGEGGGEEEGKGETCDGTATRPGGPVVWIVDTPVLILQQPQGTFWNTKSYLCITCLLWHKFVKMSLYRVRNNDPATDWCSLK